MGLALLFLGAGVSAQQTVAVTGRLLDAGSGAPIEGATVDLLELGAGAITDSLGAFRIQPVPPGAYVLRVRHVAYGVHVHDVEVPEDQNLSIELKLSPQALALEPLEVEVPGRPRAENTSTNVITRAQIEKMLGQARNIGDVVTRYIPSAHATEATGGYLCLEFRGASSSRTTGCNYPLVVVDGLPITDAGRFLRDLPLRDLEKIEFVPASEGTVRYGQGATYGVLVIETRHADMAQEERPPEAPRYAGYEWSPEEAAMRHGTLRTFGGAMVGGLAGTALGLAALGCFPGSSVVVSACVRNAGVGAGLGAVLLPVVGSVVGSRLLGATEESHGRTLLNAGLSLLPALLGYASYSDGVVQDFGGERAVGVGLVVIGVPLVATLSDYLFRTRR